MKNVTCSHPKKKVAGNFDKKTNTYIEHCINCGKTIYVRKFPKVGEK